MKKTILSLIVLIAASVSFTSMAQKPCEKKCAKEGTECVEKGAKCDVLFEGITLTADQQAKVDALKADCKKDRADKAKEKAEKGKDNRKAQLNKMKEILTPEQYVVFLENAFVAQPAGKAMRPGDRKADVKKDLKARGGDMKKDIRKVEKKAEKK